MTEKIRTKLIIIVKVIIFVAFKPTDKKVLKCSYLDMQRPLLTQYMSTEDINIALIMFK